MRKKFGNSAPKKKRVTSILRPNILRLFLLFYLLCIVMAALFCTKKKTPPTSKNDFVFGGGMLRSVFGNIDVIFSYVILWKI